jgi:hypothetical protein
MTPGLRAGTVFARGFATLKLNLAQYSMGFLELFPPNRVELRGSGTLVRVGSTYGVLTAAHVWRVVSKLQEVGIYLYPARKGEIQAVMEDPRVMDAVSYSNDRDDELGPDIAFVRLRHSKASSIEKFATFLNLDMHAEKTIGGAPEGSVSLDAVAGGVEELGQKENVFENRKLVIQNSLLLIGHATEIADGRDGFDRLEFTPDHDADFVPPSSYGGMSGGGCFRVYFPPRGEGEPEPIAFHLLGVAFYETKLDGKPDKLICHGRGSLREKLLPAVRAKWAD